MQVAGCCENTEEGADTIWGEVLLQEIVAEKVIICVHI